MALQKSGVQLVAEGYQQYLQQMREVNKAHKEAFSGTGINTYKNVQKQAQQATANTVKGVTGLRGVMMSLGSGNVLGALKSLRGALLSVQAALGILIAIPIVAKLIGFGKQASDIATRNETLAVSLRTLSKEYGYTSKQIDIAVGQLQDQGITTMAAQESLMRMARANIEWSEASKLAAIAQGSAVAAGMTSSDAFNRLVLGIQKMEPELLDELGITLRRTEAYKKYAAQMGLNERNLTDQQKQQAILNEVYAQSEKVLGVYTAAMGTAGKQESSLVRIQEETQNNVGKILLTFRSLSVEMKTNLWKALRNITLGFSSMAPVMKVVIEDFKVGFTAISNLVKATLGVRQSTNLFEVLGERMHYAAQTAMKFQIIVSSALTAVGKNIEALVSRGSKALQALFTGDFVGAGREVAGLAKSVADAGGAFHEEFARRFAKAQEEFPDLWKTWEELSSAAEGGLERENNALADNIAALNERKKALEQQAAVLEQIEEIERDYSKSIAKAGKDYAKSIEKLEKDLAKAREKAAEKMTKALENLEKDSAKKRADVLEESRREEIESQKDLYKDLEQERRRFELNQLQDLRRFKLSEKRLQSEGDILGLIQLREDFDLQKKEAKENYNLSQTEQKEAAEEQLRKQREDVQERLKELETEIQERRAEIQQSYQDELNELVQSNQERKAEALASYQEQLSDLKAGRADQLKELARSLADEANITDEGMKEVADKIRNVFGEDELADELLYQWAYRAQTVMGQAMEDIKDQIASVEAQISALESGEDVPASTPPTTDYGAARRGSRGRRRGMRSGGEGEVIGPALFEVEPGVRERVAFAPVGASARNQLDVNVAGGIDVRGAEGASPGIVDAAVESMMSDFTKAVRRLTKR